MAVEAHTMHRGHLNNSWLALTADVPALLAAMDQYMDGWNHHHNPILVRCFRDNETPQSKR